MAGKTSDRVADQRKEIVDHVIEEMGKGGFSWLKPWADSASPHNPVTGSTYHGRNRMHLAVMAAIKGYLKGLDLTEGKEAVSEKKVPVAKETKAVGINELADSVGADDKGIDAPDRGSDIDGR